MNDKDETGTDLTARPTNTIGLVPAQPFDLTPRSLEEAFKLADMLAQSELVPKDFRGKPANVLVAVQWGQEIGLKPMQALQNIAVINGRPSLWGDAMIALVRADARCEYIVESFDAAETAVCQVKRRGEQEQVRTFSIADSKTAGLFGKSGPWESYPKRMRQMRARALALRDVFADVLKGIPMAEEAFDLLPVTATATPLGQLEGVAAEIPAELLKAAQDAASSGREAFAKWFKDKANGGQTTAADRALLAPRLEELKAITAKADAAWAEAKAKTEKPPADPAPATAETGPTYGDDLLGQP